MRQLQGIQCLRGIAALSVVLYHATGLVEKYGSGYAPALGFFEIGSRGVQLFFALSGFIICYAHYDDIDRPARVGHYLYRRFTRIYPTLWVVWAVSAIGYGAGYHPERSYKLAPWNLVKSFWVYPLPPDHYIVNASWTLTWEMAFYLIFALLVVHRWLGLAAFLAWQALTILANVLQPDWPTEVMVLLNPNVFFFLPGMATAWLFVNRDRFPALRSARLAIAAIWIGAAGFVFEAWRGNLRNLENPDFNISTAMDVAWLAMFYLGPCLVILGCALREAQGGLRINRWLLAAGTASYSIYLVHNPILGMMARALAPWPNVLGTDIVWLVMCAVAVGAGYIFYQLVERRLIRLFARLPSVLAPASVSPGP